MIFYYSGCGNSSYVSRYLSENQNDRLIFVPKAERDKAYQYKIEEGEKVGFVFPVYAWGPPQLVLDFVQKLHFIGKPSFTYLVVTYGDNAGKTSSIFRKTLHKIGLDLEAAYGIAMPNTYVILGKMNVDSLGIASRKLQKAQVQLPIILQNIQQKKGCYSLLEGSMAYLKSYVIRPFFNRAMTDKPFYSTNKCIACGKCAQVCPLNNIEIKENKPCWMGNCTNCLACYHYCPVNAIQYGKVSSSKGQYFFGITLS